MTKQEFKQSLELAKSPHSEDLTPFFGYGFRDFTPVWVTLSQVATLLRWQALFFDGTWDNEEINNIWNARRKFNII